MSFLLECGLLIQDAPPFFLFERNFPLSVLPFSFPLSFKLFVASITLAESEEELNKEPLYARGE